MIEVSVSIPIEEYWHVKEDLEASFNKHKLVVTLSADTVIRTWATLTFGQWFDQQDMWVDHYIGWGELGVEWQEEPMIAACSSEMVEEGYQPRVVMTFYDEPCEFAEISEETAKQGRDTALMFKLAFGGK